MPFKDKVTCWLCSNTSQRKSNFIRHFKNKHIKFIITQQEFQNDKGMLRENYSLTIEKQPFIKFSNHKDNKSHNTSSENNIHSPLKSDDTSSNINIHSPPKSDDTSSEVNIHSPPKRICKTSSNSIIISKKTIKDIDIIESCDKSYLSEINSFLPPKNTFKTSSSINSSNINNINSNKNISFCDVDVIESCDSKGKDNVPTESNLTFSKKIEKIQGKIDQVE